MPLPGRPSPPADEPAPAAREREAARVREANRRFYQALESLSLDDMEAVWLPSPSCRCVHPGCPPVVGWQAIRASWSRIFADTADLAVALDPASIAVHIEGAVAWLVCLARVSTAADGRLDSAMITSSNLFVLHEGEWRLVLHHASQLPDPLEAPRTDLIQ